MNICIIKWFDGVLASGKSKAKLSWKKKETVDPTPLNKTLLLLELKQKIANFGKIVLVL